MIIKTQKELNEFCKDLRKHPFISIDTEFLREKTYYPKLCLVQLSGPDKKAQAIDPMEGDLDLTPLFDLLADKKVLKVFHAARQDLEIFFNLTGKVVEPFFDTQIAAMVCGYGDSVGYESLVRNITGGKLDKSVQYTNWAQRPLSERQIRYALDDVTHLVDIYKHLSALLEKQGRTSWVYEEEEILANPATYENLPDEAWKRIKLRSPKPKTLAILRELAGWREKRAQEKDIPRTWVMRDETLADMAAQAPQDAQQLAKIRNMSADLAKGNVGDTLLKLIEKAENSDKKTWPRVEKESPLSGEENAIMDVLKLLLKIQAAQHGVASKLIASSEDLRVLATEKNPETPALKGWRYELFGRFALDLRTGSLALGLRNGQIKKFKISIDSSSDE